MNGRRVESSPGRGLLLRKRHTSDTTSHHITTLVLAANVCVSDIFSELSRPQMSTERARNTAERRGGRD